MVRVSELPALKMREISAQSQSVGRVQERSDCEKLEDKTESKRLSNLQQGLNLVIFALFVSTGIQ